MVEILQHVAFGIGTGSYLLLGAIGFALIAQVEGFLNVAHASFILVGAYTTWMLNSRYGVDAPIAGALAVVVTALVALVVYVAVYRPIRPYGSTVMLISSVGVTFIMQGLVEMMVGHGTHLYDVALPQLLQVGGVALNPYHLMVIGMAIAILVLLETYLRKTRTGRHIRAVSVNAPLAQSRGISLDRTSQVVWLMAGGAAGVAGVMLGLLGTLTTDIAFQQILLFIAVSILAGFRSLWALAIAAIVTGLAMDLSTLVISASYRSTIPYVIIIVALVLRPQGLLGWSRA